MRRVPVSLALLAPLLLGGTAESTLLEDFQNPPSVYRPRFRYWLPDASVPASSVQDDVQAIADVGAGGLEFLPFYNYGLGPVPGSDWEAYGFGSEPFQALFAAALDTCAANGLGFDFAFGANQGAGVPSAPESPGLAMELVYGNQTVLGGETFAGAPPAPNIAFNALTGFMGANELWGSNKLVAVTAAQVEYEVLLAEYFAMASVVEGSLTDLTDLVAEDGSLTWTAPVANGTTTTTTWAVFAFYERYSMQRSCVAPLNATSALTNGSWVVDHFSGSGAKKMTDFWDEHILSDEAISSILSEVGGYAWEDSLEIQTALWWTSGFLERFEESRGYSLAKYLPLVFHASNQWGGYLPPYNTTYSIGPYTTIANKWQQDYRLTLDEGYAEYLTGYTTWAEGLGLGLRTQPAYNLPMEMAKAIPLVTAPELESLGFEDDIDLYRQFTGAAHLAGRQVISTEVGAVNNGPYKQTIPELASLFAGSFAAGVNNMVIHGYAYGGEYISTNWPGYTPFQYEYTEMWNPRQPAWGHFNDTLLWAARNSLVVRSGVPRIDVAFYYYESPWVAGQDIYAGEDFNAAGYTHEYLGPSNLVSEQAIVKDGILAPDGPAYKALVLFNQTYIDPAASAALIQFAKAGLPIYIVGSVPNTTIGINGQDEVTANMDALVSSANVQVMSTDQFSADTLAVAGITPKTGVQGGADATQLFTFWRSETETATEAVYLLNRGGGGTFNIVFNVPESSKPYILNTWTGAQDPVLLFNRTSHGVAMDITLEEGESTVVVFLAEGCIDKKLHVVGGSSNIVGVQLGSSDELQLLVDDFSAVSVSLSNGTDVAFSEVESLQNVTIGPWSLTVNAYGPTENNETVQAAITPIEVGTLDTLAPWTNISGLEQVSGVGMYTATFDYPYSREDAGGVLRLGPVLNTIRVWINGEAIPPINVFNAQADVSEYLVQGANELRVEVSSTLFNAVKANLDGVRSIGSGPQTPSRYTDEDWAQFGLIGPVEVQALRRIVVA